MQLTLDYHLYIPHSVGLAPFPGHSHAFNVVWQLRLRDEKSHCHIQRSSKAYQWTEGGGGMMQPRMCRGLIHTYIPYIVHNTQRSIYTLNHARAKSRSLESANGAKTGQIMRLERHKEPYNTANWTCKRGM